MPHPVKYICDMFSSYFYFNVSSCRVFTLTLSQRSYLLLQIKMSNCVYSSFLNDYLAVAARDCSEHTQFRIHLPCQHIPMFYQSILLSVYPFIRLSVYPSIRPSVYPSIRLSVFPSIRLSVYPCICISICLISRGEPTRHALKIRTNLGF